MAFALPCDPRYLTPIQPWERLATETAPDGQPLELRRRSAEYRIRAGGHELMSSDDESSSRSLAELGCAHIAAGAAARVLVGGLGMGYTLRAALDRVGPRSVVEVASAAVACTVALDRLVAVRSIEGQVVASITTLTSDDEELPELGGGAGAPVTIPRERALAPSSCGLPRRGLLARPLVLLVWTE